MVNLKKVTASAFVRELKDNLEYFRSEMERKNFSDRNDKEWFKLLGDYLGLSLNDFSKDDDFDSDED